MIRVGIVFGFDENWLGGINYFRNLLNAVYNAKDRKIEVVIFTGHQVSPEKFKGFPQVQIVRSRFLDSTSLAWRVRRLLKRLLKRDWLLEQLLVRHKVNVLSHSGWLGRKSAIQTIGWIPDFQSFRLPGFFTSKEVIALNKEFQDLCKYCTKVMVSSNDALKDLHKYFPESQSKSVVLRFSVVPESQPHRLPKIEELQERYDFTGKYFLLPNQFWAHKNHKVVIDALAKLKVEGCPVLVLATGNTKDYRRPDFFAELTAHIKLRKVGECFKILGIIPLNDLSALMQMSIATINPSLFEGWSTTVEEAKSLGKKIILSDIPVHREQDPPGGMFFPVDDSQKLAAHLKSLWDNADNSELNESAQAAQVAYQRHIQFFREYQDLVLSVVGSDESKPN